MTCPKFLLRYYTLKRSMLVWVNKHLLGTMLTVVVISFVANFCLIFTGYSKEARGTFGDQFGAVNALFSGLAFAGLIYTIILQRRDLKLQREEMRDQTKEFMKENETLRIQRFENTFFNMLSQFQEVVNNLKVTVNGISVEGRDCFEKTFEKNKMAGQEFKDVEDKCMCSVLFHKGMNGYMKSDMPKYFDHYFRLFYRILKFVKDSPLITDYTEEYEYTAMLRAILSRYELVWIYYNGLSNYGNEKLKPLIERYAMLKNLRDEHLVKGTVKGLGEYEASAYMKTQPEAVVEKDGVEKE